MNLFLNLVIVSANVLGGAMAFPQAARLVRTRRVEGLSGAWVGISVAMNIWWFAYGVAAQRWALLPVSLASILLYGTIAAVLLRSGRRRSVLAAFGVVVVPLPVLVVGGWTATGVVIGLGYGVQLLPAVVSAFRTVDLRGVAFGTWLIAWVESLLWGIYGWATADVGIVVAGLLGIAMSGLILGRLAWTGHVRWARWRSAEPELSW
jgi:uncharacterized protein with PQ loop repeat